MVGLHIYIQPMKTNIVTVWKCLLLQAIVLMSLPALGQLATYTTAPDGSLSTVATNATATPLARVNGAATPGAPCGTGYTVSAFTTATIFNTGLPAVEVVVTPDAGFSLVVSGINVDLRRSGSGPANVRLAYSTNGGSTWIDQGTDLLPNNGTCGATASGSWATTISVPAPLQLRVRVYGYNAGSASGTLQLQNLAIAGTVATAPACAAPPGISATITTASSATLGWTAIPGALSYNVYYRPTGSTTWSISGSAGTSIVLSSLSPATVYECAVETVCGSGTSGLSATSFFTTATAGVGSASSGKMAVYFNRPVNTAVSTGENAVYLHNAMADTLIAYLNRAKYTVDIAQYNYNQSAGYSNIATAINNCIARGVRVRWIYDGHESNTGLALLDTAVHTLASPTTSAYGLMHNKVVIIDAQSADPNDAVVSTGSTVWGVNQFNSDYNNTIFIQDSALAHAYENHFNMMWGGSGSYPNLALSKFGPNKTDGGAHIFHIGGKTVELYFSPCDHTDMHIQAAINSANTDLYVGMYTFTMSSDASAIVSRHTAGVYAPVIVDENSTIGSAAYPILTAGLGSLLKTQTGSVIYHNKMMIADPSNTCSDPLVLTGSHNWTNSADTKNDENTLIIHSDTIANIYYQSFHANYTDLGGTLTPIPPCSSVACGTPAILPATAIGTSTAILNWASMPGAVSYNVQYRPSSGAWITTTTTTNSLTITSLTPATTYQYAVQAVCAAGAGVYSSSTTFTTLAPPCTIPSGLSVPITDTDAAQIMWGAVAGATGYELQYRISGAGTWVTTTVTAIPAILTSLAPGTTYEVRIQVLCASGTSGYSSAVAFTTLLPAAPTCAIAAFATPPATTITATTAVLRWAAVPGATSYNVRYHKTGTPIWTYTVATTNMVAVSGLTANTDYEFQVQTVCPAGNSAFNGSSLFTTRSVTEVGNVHSLESSMTLWPNPAAGNSTLQYHLPVGTSVSAAIYDMAGRLVHTILSATSQTAGTHLLPLPHLPAGVYIVRMSAGEATAVQKLVQL